MRKLLVLGAWCLAACSAFAALTMDAPFWGFTNAPAARALGPSQVFGSGEEDTTRLTRDTTRSFWGTYSAVGERAEPLDGYNENWKDGDHFHASRLIDAWHTDGARFGLSVDGSLVSFEEITTRLFEPRWFPEALAETRRAVYNSPYDAWGTDVYWTRFADWTLPDGDTMPVFDWTSNPHQTLAAQTNRWGMFSLFPADGALKTDRAYVPHDWVWNNLLYNTIVNEALWLNPENGGDIYGLSAWPEPTNTLIEALAAYIDGVYGQNTSNRWTAARAAAVLTNGTTRLAADPWVCLNNALGWADLVYGTAWGCVVCEERETTATRRLRVPGTPDGRIEPLDGGGFRYTCEIGWGSAAEDLQTNRVTRTNINDTAYAIYSEANHGKGILLALSGAEVTVTADDVAAIFAAWSAIDPGTLAADFDDTSWIKMVTQTDGQNLTVNFSLMSGDMEWGWPWLYETNYFCDVRAAATNATVYGFADKAARRIWTDNHQPNTGDLFGLQTIPVETNAWNKHRLAVVADIHAFDTKIIAAQSNVTYNVFGTRWEFDWRREFDGLGHYAPEGVRWEMRAENIGEARSRASLLSRIVNRQAANLREAQTDLAAICPGCDPNSDEQIALIDGREKDDITAVTDLSFDFDGAAQVRCAVAEWKLIDGAWRALADPDFLGAYIVTNAVPDRRINHPEQRLSDWEDWIATTNTPAPSGYFYTGFALSEITTNNIVPSVTNNLAYTVAGQRFEETYISPGETVEYRRPYLYDMSQDNWCWTNQSIITRLPEVVVKDIEVLVPGETNIYTLASNALFHVEIDFDTIIVTNTVLATTNVFETVTNRIDIWEEAIEPESVEWMEAYTVRYTRDITRHVNVGGADHDITLTVGAASNAWREAVLESPGGYAWETNSWLEAVNTNIVTEATEWYCERQEPKFRVVWHEMPAWTDAVTVGGFNYNFETNLPWRVESLPPRGVAISSSYPCRYQWKFHNLHSPVDFTPTGPVVTETER